MHRLALLKSILVLVIAVAQACSRQPKPDNIAFRTPYVPVSRPALTINNENRGSQSENDPKTAIGAQTPDAGKQTLPASDNQPNSGNWSKPGNMDQPPEGGNLLTGNTPPQGSPALGPRVIDPDDGLPSSAGTAFGDLIDQMAGLKAAAKNAEAVEPDAKGVSAAVIVFLAITHFTLVENTECWLKVAGWLLVYSRPHSSEIRRALVARGIDADAADEMLKQLPTVQTLTAQEVFDLLDPLVRDARDWPRSTR